MNTEQLLLSDMARGGLVKKEDTISWLSPFNEYTFKISKSDSQLYAPSEYQFKYIIDMTIFNNIGMIITNIRFNEITAYNICDNISLAITAYTDNFGTIDDDMIMSIPDESITGNEFIIKISSLNESAFDFNNKNSYDSKGNARDLVFSISRYCHANEYMTPLINITLSCIELDTLAYDIYFVSLLDLDLPYPENEDAYNLYNDLNIPGLYNDIVYKNKLNNQ